MLIRQDAHVDCVSLCQPSARRMLTTLISTVTRGTWLGRGYDEEYYSQGHFAWHGVRRGLLLLLAVGGWFSRCIASRGVSAYRCEGPLVDVAPRPRVPVRLRRRPGDDAGARRLGVVKLLQTLGDQQRLRAVALRRARLYTRGYTHDVHTRCTHAG